MLTQTTTQSRFARLRIAAQRQPSGITQASKSSPAERYKRDIQYVHGVVSKLKEEWVEQNLSEEVVKDHVTSSILALVSSDTVNVFPNAILAAGRDLPSVRSPHGGYVFMVGSCLPSDATLSTAARNRAVIATYKAPLNDISKVVTDIEARITPSSSITMTSGGKIITKSYDSGHIMEKLLEIRRRTESNQLTILINGLNSCTDDYYVLSARECTVTGSNLSLYQYGQCMPGRYSGRIELDDNVFALCVIILTELDTGQGDTTIESQTFITTIVEERDSRSVFNFSDDLFPCANGILAPDSRYEDNRGHAGPYDSSTRWINQDWLSYFIESVASSSAVNSLCGEIYDHLLENFGDLGFNEASIWNRLHRYVNDYFHIRELSGDDATLAYTSVLLCTIGWVGRIINNTVCSQALLSKSIIHSLTSARCRVVAPVRSSILLQLFVKALSNESCRKMLAVALAIYPNKEDMEPSLLKKIKGHSPKLAHAISALPPKPLSIPKDGRHIYLFGIEAATLTVLGCLERLSREARNVLIYACDGSTLTFMLTTLNSTVYTYTTDAFPTSLGYQPRKPTPAMSAENSTRIFDSGISAILSDPSLAHNEAWTYEFIQ